MMGRRKKIQDEANPLGHSREQIESSDEWRHTTKKTGDYLLGRLRWRYNEDKRLRLDKVIHSEVGYDD